MSSSARRVGPEALSAAVFAVFVLAFFAPMWLRGLTPFWGDMTYLHLAWRAAPAQLLQSGRAPLWEPHLYLGMPMAASQQGGLFYPPNLLYNFFGFATASAAFQALHLFLAGWLCALWLRSLGTSWGAGLGGGAALAFGGLMIARLPLLNHLAALAWAPALALLFRRPAGLALALALAYLAGYPMFLPGMAAAAWGLALALRARRSGSAVSWGLVWGGAGATAMALSAAQLLPALELAVHSRRSGGLDLAESLLWGFSPSELLRWISPLLPPGRAFRPEVEWWTCVHLGVAAAAAAALGFARLPRRRALALAALIGVALLLTLGASTPVSRAVWASFAPLKYVRYPGNLAYLALLPLAALVAAGLHARRGAAALAALIAAELLILGWRATPLAPRSLFIEIGPLARELQDKIGPTRYLLSPKALEASSGSSVPDWRARLYGLTNAPVRLRAVANFGEPLTPAASFALMDALYSLPAAAAAARWLPWLGASALLTPEPLSGVPGVVPAGKTLWALSRTPAPVSLAWKLTTAEGDALSEGIPAVAPSAPTRPLVVRREREDRFAVLGEGEGWVFVSEPRYPGWSAALVDDGGAREAASLPALGPFQKIRVPAGPWALFFRYEPDTWRWGVLVALAALLAFGGYWYHRAAGRNHDAQG